MVEITKVTERRFGVEIEFQGNYCQLLEDLQSAGIRVQQERYNHQNRPHWKIVSDSSCGWELVSPILLGEGGLLELETVCEVRSASAVVVTRTTGVHVHLDAADLTPTDIAQVVKRYHANEEMIDQWFPRSRRANNNRYCRSTNGVMDMGRIENVTDDMVNRDLVPHQRTRFCKLNIHSLRTHGTIEFRQHAGSTDFTKIGNWVLFLQHFVEQSRKTKTSAFSATYRPRKRAPFCEIREQVQMFGSTLKYAGNIEGGSRWKLTRPDGQVFVFTNTELDALYVDEGRLQGRRELKTEAVARIVQWIGAEVADASLNAGIPEEVTDWFTTRAAELAA